MLVSIKYRDDNFKKVTVSYYSEYIPITQYTIKCERKNNTKIISEVNKKHCLNTSVWIVKKNWGSAVSSKELGMGRTTTRGIVQVIWWE